MIVAGLVTGATHGIFYIRHEYGEQEHIVEEEIQRCYRDGLLGERILGSDLTFDLEVFVSPGGYICGEESALLEAIEGKRAEPRNKPPFPALQGLWQKPTVINNVETFAFATAILARGADWYKAQGVNGCVGIEVRRRQRRRAHAGRLRDPDGDHVPAVDRRLRRRARRRARAQGLRAVGSGGGYLPAASLDLPIDWAAMARRPAPRSDPAPSWSATSARACSTWR